MQTATAGRRRRKEGGMDSWRVGWGEPVLDSGPKSHVSILVLTLGHIEAASAAISVGQHVPLSVRPLHASRRTWALPVPTQKKKWSLGQKWEGAAPRRNGKSTCAKDRAREQAQQEQSPHHHVEASDVTSPLGNCKKSFKFDHFRALPFPGLSSRLGSQKFGFERENEQRRGERTAAKASKTRL